MTPRTFAIAWRVTAGLVVIAAAVTLMLMPAMHVATAPSHVPHATSMPAPTVAPTPHSAPTVLLPAGVIDQICALDADCALPPCATEGSDNCYGADYITVLGITYR